MSSDAAIISEYTYGKVDVHDTHARDRTLVTRCDIPWLQDDDG